MIINTGMRTDIPAFYSTWFLNRIKEGYVYVRNPYYRHQVTKYLLNPEVVDCLAFCTKNPHPLIAHLKELDSFRQFWFITITPYGKDMEPFVPDKNQVIQDFIVLSEHLGKKSVALRYDPICITDTFDVQKHIQCFSELLPKFKGYTENCTISFLDRYEKVKRNAPDLKEPTKEEHRSGKWYPNICMLRERVSKRIWAGYIRMYEQNRNRECNQKYIRCSEYEEKKITMPLFIGNGYRGI